MHSDSFEVEEEPERYDYYEEDHEEEDEEEVGGDGDNDGDSDGNNDDGDEEEEEEVGDDGDNDGDSDDNDDDGSSDSHDDEEEEDGSSDDYYDDDLDEGEDFDNLNLIKSMFSFVTTVKANPMKTIWDMARFYELSAPPDNIISVLDLQDHMQQLEKGLKEKLQKENDGEDVYATMNRKQRQMFNIWKQILDYNPVPSSIKNEEVIILRHYLKHLDEKPYKPTKAYIRRFYFTIKKDILAETFVSFHDCLQDLENEFKKNKKIEDEGQEPEDFLDVWSLEQYKLSKQIWGGGGNSIVDDDEDDQVTDYDENYCGDRDDDSDDSDDDDDSDEDGDSDDDGGSGDANGDGYVASGGWDVGGGEHYY